MSRRKDTPISVGQKPQLCHARDANEDWTGKASAKERRKLQNRLHQRAWRRRKAQEATHYPPDPHPSNEPQSLTDAFVRASSAFLLPPLKDSTPTSFTNSIQDLMRSGAYATPPFLSSLHYNLNKPSLPWPTCAEPHKPMLFTPIIPYLDASGKDIGFTTDKEAYPPFHPSLFPLTPDHYLITLIQYNTLRGILTNLLLMRVHLDPECQNALRIPLLHTPPSTPPPTFRLTPTQKSVKHDGWIDSVPCPTLRDNLILASAASPPTFDQDEMCDDICGGLYDGFDHVESRGLLVWGDPWLVRSWEISPGFAKKWVFLLAGCGEMVRATNTWRESRGEEPLVVEV